MHFVPITTILPGILSPFPRFYRHYRPMQLSSVYLNDSIDKIQRIHKDVVKKPMFKTIST